MALSGHIPENPQIRRRWCNSWNWKDSRFCTETFIYNTALEMRVGGRKINVGCCWRRRIPEGSFQCLLPPNAGCGVDGCTSVGELRYDSLGQWHHRQRKCAMNKGSLQCLCAMCGAIQSCDSRWPEGPSYLSVVFSNPQNSKPV